MLCSNNHFRNVSSDNFLSTRNLALNDELYDFSISILLHCFHSMDSVTTSSCCGVARMGDLIVIINAVLVNVGYKVNFFCLTMRESLFLLEVKILCLLFEVFPIKPMLDSIAWHAS